jgi:hypothetical protein
MQLVLLVDARFIQNSKYKYDRLTEKEARKLAYVLGIALKKVDAISHFRLKCLRFSAKQWGKQMQTMMG